MESSLNLIKYASIIENNEHILDKLLEKNGKTRQLLKFAEELSEFQSIYLKVIGEGTETIDIELFKALYREYADVIITCVQFDRIFQQMLPQEELDKLFHESFEKTKAHANKPRIKVTP